MKLFSLVAIASSSLFLSCTGFDQDLDPSNDPLKSPYANLKSSARGSGSTTSAAETFEKGQSVETAMPDAEFYNSYPLFRQSADRELPVATKAEILSYRGSYAKVRLIDGGVGYIPSIMLIDSYGESGDLIEVASSSEVPVIDPLSEEEILRRIDEEEAKLKAEAEGLEESSLDPNSNDFVAPEPEIQGIVAPNDLTSPSDPEMPKAPEPTKSSLPEIKIDKTENTLPTAPIDAPPGDQIIQDAALE